MTFWNRKKDRVDPDELRAQADAALEQLRAQQPRVNAVTSYLIGRRDQNGFGTDFEWTLAHPKGNSS